MTTGGATRLRTQPICFRSFWWPCGRTVIPMDCFELDGLSGDVCLLFRRMPQSSARRYRRDESGGSDVKQTVCCCRRAVITKGSG